MNDPRRLLEGDGDATEQALLRSAQDDEPKPGSDKAVLLALGLIAPGAGLPPGMDGSGMAGAGTAGGAAAGAAAKLGAWSIVKWIAIGAVAGTATVGGARALQGTTTRPPPTPVVVASPATAAASVATQAPVEPYDAGASYEPDAQAAPRVVASERPSASVDLSLAAEVAALDRAHKALESDDPAGALRAIEERGRSHPEGVLQPEAMVVRIEALKRMGRQQAAAELGRQFLAKYPNHPLRERVRVLMNDSDAGSTKEGARP